MEDELRDINLDIENELDQAFGEERKEFLEI